MPQYETPNMIFPQIGYYGPQPFHPQLIHFNPIMIPPPQFPPPIVHFGPQVSYVAHLPKERVIEYQMEMLNSQIGMLKQQIEMATAALKEMEKQKEGLAKTAKEKATRTK